MATYSKETALYQTDGIKNDIRDAGNNAKGYMTDVSSEGVFVHEYDVSNPHPSDDTANGVHISNDVDIIRNGEVVASYGDTARIGKENDSYLEITNDSIYGVSEKISKFEFGLSTDTSVTTKVTFKRNRLSGNKQKLIINTPFVFESYDVSEKIALNGSFDYVLPNIQVEHTAEGNFIFSDGDASALWKNEHWVIPYPAASFVYDGTTQTSTFTTSEFTFAESTFRGTVSFIIELNNNILSSKVLVNRISGELQDNDEFLLSRFEYSLESELSLYAPYFRVGTSYTTNPRPFSASLGLGLYSASYQTTIGKYNRPNAPDLFQIGNGNSDSDRSNAFSVSDEGIIRSDYRSVEEYTTNWFYDGWTPYRTIDSPVVRKYGRIVSLTGALKNTTAKTLNNTPQKVFGISSGLSPRQEVCVVCNGSNTNKFLMRITTDGDVTFERYTSGTTYSSIAAGSWFPFHVTWIV